MKISTFALAALAANTVSAHYFFDRVQGTQPWQYVRRFTRGALYNPIKFSSNPSADLRDGSTIDGPDARCNQNAAQFAGSTGVLEVRAGEQVRVGMGVNGDLFHPGPGLVYLSRAPGDNVRNYDGSGDWFKIFEEGVCNPSGDFTGNAWCTWERTWMAATIPRDTPSGEYLMRFEHIGIHRSHVRQPEHYLSCVQIRVTNGGNGNPGPMVKFPGAYRTSDQYADFSIYGGHRPFTIPGPRVWTGGNSGSNPTTPAPNPPNPPSGNCAGMWDQCGGQGWTGPTCCSSGTCRASNQWYSQCT